MVVGGWSGTDFFDVVDLVSLDPAGHPVPECWKGSVAPFPFAMSSAAGAMLTEGRKKRFEFFGAIAIIKLYPDNVPVVCGGGQFSCSNGPDACFTYDAPSNTWYN